MKKIIPVKLKKNAYPIAVGTNTLKEVGLYLKKLNLGQDAVVISNKLILRLYGGTLKKSLKKSGFTVKIFDVPDTEKSKSSRVAVHLLEKIASYDTKKRLFIIAFGGGVIGDLAGFVASVYKRGIPYAQIPTTFLAQIDSAIGGKTAIDLSVGKNLAGSFYQPRVVWSDAALLLSLGRRQIRNGLAEAVKYGIIADHKLFCFIEKNYGRLLNGDLNALLKVIAACSRIKADVVRRDEREQKGIRTILNFGHTIGHAVEAAGGYRVYHHGEAIALGMRVACRIAVLLKLFSAKEEARIVRLLNAIELPLTIRKIGCREILRIMEHDKKFLHKKNRFVLPVHIGAVKVKEGIPTNIITRAVKDYR